MRFTNNAVIDGDAQIGGRYVPASWEPQHVKGTMREGAGPVDNLPVSRESCYPLDLDTLGAALESELGAVPANAVRTGYPNNRWTVRPSGMRRYDETWDVEAWIDAAPSTEADVLGRATNVVKTRTFDLKNGELRIAGGDVVMYIDGDLNAASGGGKMVIENGSSLTVYVTGRTRLGSSFKIVDENNQPVTATITDTGRPTFTIVSLHEGDMGAYDQRNTSGVFIEGAAQVPVNVYAPNTGVYVTAGGDLYGAIRGKRVVVPGGAGVHYDLALGAVELGEPGGDAGAPTYRVIGRR